MLDNGPQLMDCTHGMGQAPSLARSCRGALQRNHCQAGAVQQLEQGLVQGKEGLLQLVAAARACMQGPTGQGLHQRAHCRT